MTSTSFMRKFPDNLPEAILLALGPDLISVHPVGSRETCNPAPVDTDEDWLVLAHTINDDLIAAQGFSQEGQPEFYTGTDEGGFRSWRKGDLNMIVTTSAEFADKFLLATYLAKRFNLLAKADRIALFQAILYGVTIHNLEPIAWKPAWNPEAVDTTTAKEPSFLERVKSFLSESFKRMEKKTC